jgi:pimeloyl-ACP methyl ester carboxylesterase
MLLVPGAGHMVAIEAPAAVTGAAAAFLEGT